MKAITAFAALACLVSLPAIAAGDAKPKVIAFNASVKVEVDAAGKPVKVEAPADLPEVVRSYIEKRVASWQYLPAREGGVPAPATTYVNIGACAIPAGVGNQYQFGLDFKGNGPQVANKYNRLMPTADLAAAVGKSGFTGTFEVTLSAQPDGEAKPISITRKAGPPRGVKDVEQALRKWVVRDIRFEPERVAGKAVATQVRFDVQFSSDSAPSARELQQRALNRSECKLASGDANPGLEAIALDSPVKVTAIPAS